MSKELMFEMALAKVVREACKFPGRIITACSGHYFYRPKTGQGAYFIFQNQDDSQWYWMEVEEEGVFGPYKKQREALVAVDVEDKKRWLVVFDKWYESHVARMTEIGIATFSRESALKAFENGDKLNDSEGSDS